MANNLYSIVLPTYSGLNTLSVVLESIARQPEVKLVDLVIVIDGPNKKLKSIADDFTAKNEATFKSVTVKQFRVNKGRFIARQEGAKLARGNTLIFIDDRTELTQDYLKNIFSLASAHPAIISNIIEDKQTANFVGNTLTFIRSRLYKNWGKDFTDYEITEENFDKSPKGTAGLCVKKTYFLESAQEFVSTSSEVTTNSNDDTKLLRLIMKRTNLYRSAKPKLVYMPRGTAYSELVHIFKRGPMFVDYYLAKKSPYFSYLIVLYVAAVLTLAVAVMYPVVLLVLIAVYAVVMLCGGLLAKGSSLDKIKVGGGLMVIPLFFGAGIFVGTGYKVKALLTKGM